MSLLTAKTANAREGKSSGIVFKMNSLQDKEIIDALYAAGQAGVPVRLIVRGICCVRPGRVGLSENIKARSIVGDYLEHSRVFYFHDEGQPQVLVGSADLMERSFDRRLESLFFLLDEQVKREVINILVHNLKDNYNTYELQEDGSFEPATPQEGEERFNLHKRLFQVTLEEVNRAPMELEKLLTQ